MKNDEYRAWLNTVMVVVVAVVVVVAGTGIGSIAASRRQKQSSLNSCMTPLERCSESSFVYSSQTRLASSGMELIVPTRLQVCGALQSQQRRQCETCGGGASYNVVSLIMAALSLIMATSW